MAELSKQLEEVQLGVAGAVEDGVDHLDDRLDGIEKAIAGVGGGGGRRNSMEDKASDIRVWYVTNSFPG